MHDVTLCFPFIHQWGNVRLLCFVSHSNDMKSCQSNSAENVSCNVAPFFYDHSVVMQHLVSETLYQTGNFRQFQRKTYIMLDKYAYCVYRAIANKSRKETAIILMKKVEIVVVLTV